jgi:CDP-glycerol glycerophosphotransferase
MNDENKRNALNKKFGIENNYFIETETIDGMWYALRAKTWVTNAFETPVGGVFLKYNRIVYLLGHGALFRAYVFTEKILPLKKKIYYYLIKNNFSHYLLTSKNLTSIAVEIFKCKEKQLVIAGEPMSDGVFMPDKKIFRDIYGKDILDSKNILYAPTWRQDGQLKLFPFEDIDWDKFISFLDENDINIFLRLHPSYEEDLSFYTKKTEHIKIIDTLKVEDINEVIGLFDLVITDYSSVHIGYMLTKKPVMFLPYDFDKYDKSMGFVMPYEEITPGPKPKTLLEFQEEIIKLLDDEDYYLEERKNASLFFNDFEKDNCYKNAKILIDFL